ncbi:diphosphomevalonate decarboxylase [Pseudoclavibacter sp. VKM Ac-2888]|nr:diphosphomevalonate decarboxylase [Pseudoclavibacter sp. VKM Ac-2888]PPF34102.1 diphosphomevalonate decarboxylase [Pseudoclavibacter sp. AY1H1]PPG04041.1 diphosphomevalonate decarboxylase [Pseudoclavibacter sp. RFBI5]
MERHQHWHAAVTATAVAYPNIALIKYWGKRDEALIIPQTSSLSLTLAVYPTTTTVSLLGEGQSHEILQDGTAMPEAAAAKVARFLDHVGELAGSVRSARVETSNAGPTGAGLASSASGFAALAAAASSAYGLDLSPRELSRLARRGSGSASRSIFGGFAVWNAGTDDLSSYAEPVDDAHIDAAMVLGIVNAGAKSISSREAMRRTVETSPYNAPWVETNPGELALMRDALRRGDFTEVGEISERNALRMHAAMLGAVPPVRYLTAGSMALLDAVAALRRGGLEAYATMDAGPNVKTLCRASEAPAVRDALASAAPGTEFVIAPAGPGVAVTNADAQADAAPGVVR